MSRSLGKFIAILMLLWLPLFSGSALAAAVAMQMPNGSCHETAMQMEATDMDMDMGDHDGHISVTDEHGNSCNALCHLACTGYLGVVGVTVISAHATERQITPYLVSFRSITSVPLVPPPLAPV